VCNLASICLPRFIEVDEKGNKTYNFNKLKHVAGVITKNLNKIIDKNFYPTPETKKSNMRHRPIGIGVQGLSDVYNIFHYPFESQEAMDLNKKIFETIYYGALCASNELAEKDGPYETFKGSPFSKGILQFDMWGLKDDDLLMDWDWKKLREDIKTHGTRNSLLTALMPTASTSQLMNNTECFEVPTTNLYTRTTLAGEYTVINEYLVNDLIKLGLWDDDMRKEILFDNGSIQNNSRVPDNLKKVYKTAFELPQKYIIKQSVERGPFIDQSQSMNLFIATPNFNILTSCHFYGWKNGIKTGMYYLRGRPAVDPIKFGLDIEDINRIKNKRNSNNTEEDNSNDDGIVDRRADNYEECEMCSG